MRYEWTLSLWLRPEASDEFIAELYYHLGLTDKAPAYPTLELAQPAFAFEPVVRLERRQHWSGRTIQGVDVRSVVRDDVMEELIRSFLRWLAAQSQTDGWIGLVRVADSLVPRV